MRTRIKSNGVEIKRQAMFVLPNFESMSSKDIKNYAKDKGIKLKSKTKKNIIKELNSILQG